ncbi:cell division FtsA domain-containing protein [Desulfitibacter alkalitolerans]|uniref:cell division FtsA domain-containing protein n=1 Tax=Desulfitibacter alkalitolerans TaxID=264641 RepID=UPI0004899D70|nr:cell division FtsA domain-containing protein [Desulfitibacter alkalitolerans]
MRDKKLYFSLDVGTRTVIGAVLEERNEKFHILAAEIEEHNTRAMLDGQIHDIPAVTEVVKKVKTKLEKKVKSSLSEVSVAAAGRALYTQKASITKNLLPGEIITDNSVYSLVMAGVLEAEKLIKESTCQQDNNYYCVGYSVIKYYLDFQEIKNLVGQRGNQIGVDIIATFLPRIVVDSLNSVITGADLVIKNMTLEPIAASSIVISEGMRRLNIALVDIGAGTSDIAVSINGAISSYAMVPCAGDMITEAVSEKLLVDFNTAEDIKKRLNTDTNIIYKDILGMTLEMSSREILDLIFENIEILAKKISHEIISLNGKTPQAVILIGGGSLTPLLPERIAEEIGLPRERVAIRGREIIDNIIGANNKLNGPMAITPLGIALTQSLGMRNSFEFLRINGEMIRIFGREKLTVLDALMASGVKSSEIYAKPGAGITIEFNNKIMILKGKKGIDPQIKINEKLAGLDDLVQNGDNIIFIPAQPGEDAKGIIKDILPDNLEKTLLINGQKRYLKPIIYQNGIKVKLNAPLIDKAVIYVNNIDTITDVLHYLEIEKEAIQQIYVNSKDASLETEVHNHDEITIVYKSEADSYENQEINGPLSTTSKIQISVNGEQVFLDKTNAPLMLLDIFKAIDFSPTPPIDKNKLVLKVNNEKAAYTSYIESGDEVEIFWE